MQSTSSSQSLDREAPLWDGLIHPVGRIVEPGDLWRCGLSIDEVRSAARNLFASSRELEHSCYYSLQPANAQYSDFETSCAILDRGKKWLIEPFQDIQPATYALLSEDTTQLCAGFRVFFMGIPFNEVWVTHHQLLFVRGRAIQLEWYHSPEWSPEVRGTGSNFDGGSVPEVLLKTWSYRVAGWHLVRSIPWAIPEATPAEPLPQWPSTGTGINELLAHMGAAFRKTHLPAYKERFGADAVTKVFDVGRVALRCFIDTRPPMTKRVPGGDQLFLHRGRSDKVVYHVHGGRYDELRVLAPEHLTEAFDRYFAHVLSRTPGEFDFMPYSRVL